MALLLDNCEGILLSLDSHKSVPAPFLTKTYQLVDDPSTDHIVSWGEDDSTFVVWRPPEFARDLLPNYFKHNNFSSFVRQLNTYGFRKIVPDRWEFANEYFKKGEKHLLCEIHRRKTTQPQQTGINHLHHHHQHQNVPPSFFPFSNTRVSISPPNDHYSDEHFNNWSCDSSPLTSPSFINGGTTTTTTAAATTNNYNTSVTALSEDNERLRRSNNMLMSELAHMKKLYNDIIYFVQNHVKPVTPSNTYSSSFLLPQASSNSMNVGGGNVSMVQRPMNNHSQNQNQLLGYYCNNTNNNNNSPKNVTQFQAAQNQSHAMNVNSPTNTSRSSITMVEGHTSNNNSSSKTKLFGVSLQSNKKRVHPECGSNNPNNLETNKARLILDQKDHDFDLGLNLMPPSTC
ncbi:hypothetical protein TSUD_305320 [Trifolium subterraneum]|uniref:HSF-type DNA-binding domain-containing protein n=1 Tax=Trifolium subterraneum TaxID=3900 RepID=A0A2Z6PEE5_TRISU|nr:hypothetical protein TSUD_305320 [Trifolium subterraneum]